MVKFAWDRDMDPQLLEIRHQCELLRKDLQIFALRFTLNFGIMLTIGCVLFYFAMKLT